MPIPELRSTGAGAPKPVLKVHKRPKPKAEKAEVGQIDIPLLTIVLLLLLFGLVMLFSASYPSGYMRWGDSFAYIGDQLKFAVLGIAGMALASTIDYRILRKFAFPVMVLSLLLLFVALLMPATNGAHRWVYLNPISKTMGFQPSEIAKYALIMVFAKMIAANQSRIKSFTYGFLPFVAVLGTMAVLLILEPHLSCTLLVLGIGVSMMFAGGSAIKYFAMTGGGMLAALYFTLTQFPDLVPYAMKRIDAWRNPLSSGSYQIKQSLIAVGSGGFTGRGIGASVQKFLYLPEVYNDYIYAVVCEELGTIGAIAIIVLFLLFLARGLFIAVRAKDRFGAMLAVGISVQIALQAFLHIAVNLNAIPSTGISMPFFSYGGTSLCMLLGQVGILLSVSRKADLRLQRVKDDTETAQPVAGEKDRGVE